MTVPVKAPLGRPWSERFALDIAMSLEGTGYKAEEVLEAHGVTPDELVEYGQDPMFSQLVTNFRVQLRERGFTFKLKAQSQAELLLDNSWDIIHDYEVSPAVKADLIKWTAKMAGYEPTKDGGAGNDSGVTINIHMGEPSLAPPAEVKAIDHE